MKTLKALSVLVPALLLFAGKTSADNLVVNGTFESPYLAGPLTVPVGGTAIPGWQVSGAPVVAVRAPFNEGHETLLAGDGFQCIDLTGGVPDGRGALEQVIATVPGKDYVLTFQLGMYPGSSAYNGPVRVRATAGSTTAEFRHDTPVAGAGGVWQSFALPFQANNATTLIRLQNLQANHWCGLDRVAIAEVTPDTPHSFALVSSTVDGGGGVSTRNDGRFSISGTIGQPDAGLLESNGKHLAGGFWGPVNRLSVTPNGDFVRVSWDFGLGFSELQTTTELAHGPTTSWIPVSLAGNAGNVQLPANDPMRFFRIVEN